MGGSCPSIRDGLYGVGVVLTILVIVVILDAPGLSNSIAPVFASSRRNRQNRFGSFALVDTNICEEHHMSQESSVIGTYKHIDEAEEAVRKLGASGFPVDHVSIIAKDLGTEKKVHGYVTSCDVGKSAAKTGAWVGGIFGLLVGAAFLWVPGVGPLIVAGSLTAALVGGLEGAVAGAAAAGFLGWLATLGISKEHILKYEESVRAGKYLVIAHGTADKVATAKKTLEGTQPAELNVHAPAA